jgi:hypothetical protein
MRKLLALIVTVGFACQAGSVFATPGVTYDEATGNIKFVNDTASPIDVIFVQSASGALTGTPLDNVWATTYPGDHTGGLTYLSIHVGTFDAGNVVTAHTPIADLTVGYYQPFGPGAQLKAGVVTPSAGIPEPASFALCGLSFVGLLAARRRGC